MRGGDVRRRRRRGVLVLRRTHEDDRGSVAGGELVGEVGPALGVPAGGLGVGPAQVGVAGARGEGDQQPAVGDGGAVELDQGLLRGSRAGVQAGLMPLGRDAQEVRDPEPSDGPVLAGPRPHVVAEQGGGQAAAHAEPAGESRQIDEDAGPRRGAADDRGVEAHAPEPGPRGQPPDRRGGGVQAPEGDHLARARQGARDLGRGGRTRERDLRRRVPGGERPQQRRGLQGLHLAAPHQYQDSHCACNRTNDGRGNCGTHTPPVAWGANIRLKWVPWRDAI